MNEMFIYVDTDILSAETPLEYKFDCMLLLEFDYRFTLAPSYATEANCKN